MTKTNMKLLPGMLLFAIIWLASYQHVNTQLTMVREFATDDDHQLAQSPATRATLSAEDSAGGIANDNIIQKLQGLPTDKLKTLLKIINKQDVDSAGAAVVELREPAHLKMATKDRPKLIRLDGNDDIENRHENGVTSSNDVGRKMSFHHRLSRLGNNGENMDVRGASDGNTDESELHTIANDANDDNSEIKSEQKTTATGSLRQLGKIEPVTSVLIHSFEADKDEDKEMNPGLRGASREENVVKLNANLRHPVRLHEENRGGNVDVFAGMEEKSDENTGNANQIRPNEHGLKLSRLHPKLRRIDTNFDSEQSAEVEKLSVNNEHPVELQQRQDGNSAKELDNAPSPTEETPMHSHNDVTTFVNPVSLSPVRIKQNHEANYHKIIKEKLPAKIIEEINEAMIERVKESGDKRKSSPQSAESQSPSDKQGDSTSSQEPMDILTATGQPNITEMDGNKRVAAASKASKAQFAFSYDPDSPIGPEMWKVLHTDWTCQGRKQSPINIKSENVINDTICKNIIIRTEPEGRPISGILRNNGHAPTLSLTSSASVRLMGGTLPNDYFLKQLHFHFGCENARGSEHKIDGQSYPLELHLVFWDKKTFESFAEAAKSDRGIAVVAVLFQRSFVPVSQVRNTPVTQLLQVLKKIPSEGDFVQISEMFDFRLEKLIPNVMNSVQADRFFTYEGSLTTPGCYESVIWIVFNTHPIITDDQLEMFRKLKSSKVNVDGTMCNNFRPIQKSYGRRIYSNIL